VGDRRQEGAGIRVGLDEQVSDVNDGATRT